MTREQRDSPSAEFKLSITRAMADQLAEELENLQPAPLTAERLAQPQPRPGVYETLLRDGYATLGPLRSDQRPAAMRTTPQSERHLNLR